VQKNRTPNSILTPGQVLWCRDCTSYNPCIILTLLAYKVGTHKRYCKWTKPIAHPRQDTWLGDCKKSKIKLHRPRISEPKSGIKAAHKCAQAARPKHTTRWHKTREVRFRWALATGAVIHRRVWSGTLRKEARIQRLEAKISSLQTICCYNDAKKGIKWHEGSGDGFRPRKWITQPCKHAANYLQHLRFPHKCRSRQGFDGWKSRPSPWKWEELSRSNAAILTQTITCASCTSQRVSSGGREFPGWGLRRAGEQHSCP